MKKQTRLTGKQGGRLLRGLCFAALLLTLSLLLGMALADDLRPQETDIGLEKAMALALSHVGGGQVSACELDEEDGARVYEVEIILDGKEHSLLVSAKDGAISRARSKNLYRDDEAKLLKEGEQSPQEALALAVSLCEGEAVKLELDEERGLRCYEIRLFRDGVQIDLVIAADGGRIVSLREKDEDGKRGATGTGDVIGEDKACQIALERTGGGKVLSCRLEQEDGRRVYDIEILDGQTEYDLEIDAVTGRLLDFERDRLD